MGQLGFLNPYLHKIFLHSFPNLLLLLIDRIHNNWVNLCVAVHNLSNNILNPT